MFKMKKIPTTLPFLFLLFLGWQLLIPVKPLHANTQNPWSLAPTAGIPALEMALKELELWKKNNRGLLKQLKDDKIRQTYLHTEARSIFQKRNIFNESLSSRFEYALKVLEGVDPFATQAIEDIRSWCILHPQYFHNGGLTPEGYHEFDLLFQNKYQFMNQEEITRSDGFNSHINLTIALDWFIFNFYKGEKELLELCWLNEQLVKELDQPGSGNIPTIAAISDIHGGARRFIPLIAYAFGLPADNTLYTVNDLKKALQKKGIIPQNKYIRFVAMSDIPDRGRYPVESQRLVEYLTSELHIGKFLIGNHDLWRMNGVLGVHKLKKFAPFFRGEKYRGPKEFENNHPAFWANEAVHHSGWGSNEADELNQERINALLLSYNKKYKLLKADTLPPIDLFAYRESIEGEIKKLKKFNNQMREAGKLDQIKAVPGIFDQTLRFLNEETAKRNEKIHTLNLSRSSENQIPALTFTPMTLENYSEDTEVLEHTFWVGRHFRLYYIDPFGNLHWHTILPVEEIQDKNGEKRIDFNVSYRGRTGLKALEAMQNNVQKFFSQYSKEEFIRLMKDPSRAKDLRETMWNEIGDILTLVDSWYSDPLGTSKLKSVQKFIDYGGHKILPSITGGTDSFKQRQIRAGMFMGHNDRIKYEDAGMDWIIFQNDMNSFIAQTDGSMSEGYDNQGRICVQGRMPDGSVKGATNFGYDSSDSLEIKDITKLHLYGSNPNNLRQLRRLQVPNLWMLNQVHANMSYMSLLLDSLLQTADQFSDLKKKDFYSFLMNSSETENLLDGLPEKIKKISDSLKKAA